MGLTTKIRICTLVDKWESIDSFNKHIFLFTTHTLAHFFGAVNAAKKVIKRVISAIGFAVCQTNKLEYLVVSYVAVCTNPLYLYTPFIYKYSCRKVHAPHRIYGSF